MLALKDIEEARAALGGLVNETPTHRWRSPLIESRLGAAGAAFLKLEVLQLTCTFKVRGALLHALALDGPARERGVTAVSAGNHAIAVAFAAQRIGTSAKVVKTHDAMRRAMGILFLETKLALEPAGTAATAALLGPLAEALRGKRVAAIVSGTNIDAQTFFEQALFP